PVAVAALVAVAPRTRLWAVLMVAVMGMGVGLIAVARSPAPQPPPAKPPAAQRVDRFGDPLPDGAIMRLGTLGFRVPDVAGIGFRPTGELVALTHHMTLHVWSADGNPKAVVTTWNGPGPSGGGAALSPDARFSAARLDRRLIVWDMSGKQPSEHSSREIKDLFRVAFSPDGNWLAVQDGWQGVGSLHLCNLREKSWSELPFR